MTERFRDNQKMAEVEALEKRYADSYRLANTNEGTGNRYRILAILFFMVTAVVALLVS